MSEHPDHPHEPDLDVDVEHLAATLRRRRHELADADGARIGQGRVVHGLTTHMWAGVEVPAVQCHAAVDPLRLYPASGPITCRRCLGRAKAPHSTVKAALTVSPPAGPGVRSASPGAR